MTHRAPGSCRKRTAAGVLLALALAPSACTQTASVRPEGEVWYMGINDPDRPTLFMYTVGVGEPVLVLHGGFGAEHSYLLDLVEPLASEYRFVLFDQRGSLRSPAADPLLSFDRLLEDIEWIQEELDVERLTILGHSMGTRLAMAYANAYPDRVKRLVLVASMPPASRSPGVTANFSRLPPAPNQLAATYLQGRPEVREILEGLGLPADDRSELLRMSHRQQTRAWRIRFAAVNLYDASKWERMTGGMALYNPHAAQLIGSSIPQTYDYVASLGEADIPVTVINGDHDFGNFTALGYEELFRRSRPEADTVPGNVFPSWHDFTDGWPQLEVHVIDRAGHNPWIDRPDETARLLRRGLSRG